MITTGALEKNAQETVKVLSWNSLAEIKENYKNLRPISV
jgi:hypothetical protein